MAYRHYYSGLRSVPINLNPGKKLARSIDIKSVDPNTPRDPIVHHQPQSGAESGPRMGYSGTAARVAWWIRWTAMAGIR